jgi:hypothetical protein
MRFILLSLLITSSFAFANIDIVDEVVLKDLAREWDKREALERDQFITCVANGTDQRTCRDPHWCLYPDKFNTKECVWYKIKQGF